MSLFEKIFGSRPRQTTGNGYFKTLTAYSPIYTTWSGNIYESELVRAAIDARSRHISKLGVQIRGSAKPQLQTRLRRGPNGFQTWSQFLYRLNTILDMQNTAFIVPVFNSFMEQTGISVILPSSYELIDVNGEPWIRFDFTTGQKASVELSRVGIMTKHQYDSDFFGAANNALNDTMALLDIQRQGISEAAKNANTFRFMAQVNNFAKADDIRKERLRFNSENMQAEGGGLLLFPNTYTNIKELSQSAYSVDTDQLEMIRTNVFNYFGVNDEIIQNRAVGDVMDAFFNGCIEPFAIQLSEVLSRMLFTEHERGHGNEVYIDANRLQYMTTSEKVSMAQQLGDRGMITINEVRQLFNYPPIEGGDSAPIRGEYYMAGQQEANNAEQE